MATRIFKNGSLYIFQDDTNLDRVNTLNAAQTTYSVDASGRHYFKQLRGDRLASIYSFLFADIRNQDGNDYADAEAFNTELAKVGGTTRADQVIHRLVSAVSTNDTLIRTGKVRLFGAVLTNDAATPLYVKYYDKATIPTVGTDIPLITVCVDTKKTVNLDFGNEGVQFQNGLGMGVTTLIPDADATDTAADDMFASTFIDAPDFFTEPVEGTVNGAATLTGVMVATGALVGASNGVASTVSVLIDQP